MISIKGLKKTLNNKEVLKGVDLDIQDGETIVILGRSGCGKSVLLKHIAGVFKPNEGSITVEGKDVTQMDRLSFIENGIRISILFQNSALFDSLTIRENVGFYIDRYSGLPDDERDRMVKEKLELVDLRGIEQMKPYQLSGGMQKRVALARSLITDPKVMLYDEPTTGLDPITADSINNLILNFHEKFKMTSIVVTHDLTSAYKVGNRIAMLHGGTIIALGTKEEIQASENPLVHSFLSGHYGEDV